MGYCERQSFCPNWALNQGPGDQYAIHYVIASPYVGWNDGWVGSNAALELSISEWFN